MSICPVCCKKLKNARYIAFADERNNSADATDWRHVGSDCWRRIKIAGYNGYKQSGDPGPRWYADQLAAIAAMAAKEHYRSAY